MEDILIPLAGMATGVILAYPIIRVAVRFVERKILGGAPSGEIAALREDVRVVQDRMESLESGDHRLTELEERVDFAERMLTQGRDASQIGPRD